MLDYPNLAPELPMELRAPANGGPNFPDDPPSASVLVSVILAVTFAVCSMCLSSYALLLLAENAAKSPPAEVRHDPDTTAARQ